MTTAVDTNVLLDILVPNPAFVGRSSLALQQAADAGGIVVCEVVYAELCCHFGAQHECDEFLRDCGIRVEGLSREAGFRASRAWTLYRRRGGKRIRILPDFLIGAHAEVQASRLLTRDRGFYREMFSTLRIDDPSGS